MVCGGDVKWFHTICCIWEWCDCCRHSKPGLIVVCSIKIKGTWAISVQKFRLVISRRLEKRAEFGKCWQALQKSALVYVAGEMGCVFNMSLRISVLRRISKISKRVGRVWNEVMFGDEWVVGKKKKQRCWFPKRAERDGVHMDVIYVSDWILLCIVYVWRDSCEEWPCRMRCWKTQQEHVAAPPQLVAIRVREPANQLRYRGSLGENLAILWLVSTGDGIAARTNELRWNHITLGQHIFKLEG